MTTSLRRRALRTGALALTGLMLFAGCAAESGSNDTRSDGTTAAPADDTMEPATITLYTSEPQEKADQIVRRFNEQYPKITVQVFRAATGDLKARIDAEKTNGKVGADVLLAADAPTFEAYAGKSMLMKYTPAEADKLQRDVIDPEGFYTGTRIIPTVIAYNTALVQKAPTSWKDLTSSELNGKVAMPDPAVSGAAAFNAAVWLSSSDLGESWMRDLAKNKPMVLNSNGPVSQSVASGATPYGVVVDYMIRELAEKGSPVAVAYPKEGVPYVSEPVGIFADTAQPKAAQKLVDFLVSEAGQKQAVEQSYLPVRGDVGTPKGAPAMSEIKVITPDLSMIQKTHQRAIDLFNELFK